MRSFVNTMVPEIDGAVEKRHDASLDLDSYRRRLKQLEAKGGEAALSMKAKCDRAQEAYNQSNNEVKDDLVKGKIARDETLETTHIVIIACQLALRSSIRESVMRLATISPTV